jgi:hypothetical protein
MIIEETLENHRLRLEHLERIEKPFYATGTWTPSFIGSTGAGTFTYVANGQIGYYTRIGRMVFIQGHIAISAIPVAPTGTMRISGLPITSANIVNLTGIVDINASNFNYSAGALDLIGYIPPNTTYIQLAETFDNIAAVDAPAGNFTNVNAALTFAGQYQV